MGYLLFILILVALMGAEAVAEAAHNHHHSPHR
jgi:hypothetical protein